jgi:membrane protease YdiL (CAAX protease family)
VPIEHLGLLAKSKDGADQAFYQIYTHATLSRIQANQLVSQLPSEPFVYQAARVQALEKAGDTDSVARFVSPLSCLGTLVLELGAWPFLGASLAVWIVFRRKLREKTIEFKGIPLESISMLDADRLAVRAAQILAIFVLAGLAVGLFARQIHLKLTDAEMSAGGGLLTIAAIYALQRVPVDGKRIMLSTMGLSTKNLGKDVLLGFAGFLAEFPMAMFLGELSVTLLKFLPKPTHPAEVLEHTHDIRTVIPILISACIIAPFWEEIAFRGLLFPGMKKLMGGLVPGMVLSSIIFASVHPQGIAEWLPLAFIGATSCYLSYQSKSLIPGIVMHGLHNAVLCLMMLLT